MIDVLAVIMALGGFGMLYFFGGGGIKLMRDKQANDQRLSKQMNNDLHKALMSHDHRQLSDFLVLWGERLRPTTKRYVEERINSLFIEEAK